MIYPKQTDWERNYQPFEEREDSIHMATTETDMVGTQLDVLEVMADTQIVSSLFQGEKHPSSKGNKRVRLLRRKTIKSKYSG